MRRLLAFVAFVLLAGCGVEARQRPVRFLSEDDPPGKAPDEPAKLIRRVYTYKTVGALELQADVFRLSNFRKGPVLLFVHGGALLGGDRGIVPVELQPLAKAGYVVVTIDHRLAPETKLPGIVEDVKDAIRWAKGDGARVFQGDPQKVAILGVSSGGYLATLAAYGSDSRPNAVVSIGGWSDVTAPFLAEPDPAALERPALTREAAFASVQDHEIAKRPQGTSAARLYLFCRQQGQLAQVVTGLDPTADAAAFDALRPIKAITSRSPPTFLVHGQEDKDVPSSESAALAQALGRESVPFELLLVPGAGQGLEGVSAAERARIYGRIKDFLDRHLHVGE